jgi:Restriction endonuclease NaeI
MSSISRIPLAADHPDHVRLAPIAAFLEKPNAYGERLTHEYPFLIDETIYQSIDATRTGRTTFDQLTSEEKKNLGSLIEVRIRDLLEVERSQRDLLILDEAVDVKNTVGSSWMIPRETWDIIPGELPGILLLCQYAPSERKCSLGLIVAHQSYLTLGQNHDKKVSVSSAGRKNIWWLLRETELPPDAWAHIDIATYRQCRQVEGGKERAAEFFKRQLDVRIERSVIQSLLFDQLDYMKRLRKNGGARDILDPQGIRLRHETQWYVTADGGTRQYKYWIATRSKEKA